MAQSIKPRFFYLSVALLLGLSAISYASQKKAGQSSENRPAKHKGQAGTIPVTAASPKARELYEQGMQDYENLYLERCNERWRAAVKEDPTIALAWAWIAFNSRNPTEMKEARSHAKALLTEITPGEQFMVQWIVK